MDKLSKQTAEMDKQLKSKAKSSELMLNKQLNIIEKQLTVKLMNG